MSKFIKNAFLCLVIISLFSNPILVAAQISYPESPLAENTTNSQPVEISLPVVDRSYDVSFSITDNLSEVESNQLVTIQIKIKNNGIENTENGLVSVNLSNFFQILSIDFAAQRLEGNSVEFFVEPLGYQQERVSTIVGKYVLENNVAHGTAFTNANLKINNFSINSDDTTLVKNFNVVSEINFNIFAVCGDYSGAKYKYYFGYKNESENNLPVDLNDVQGKKVISGSLPTTLNKGITENQFSVEVNKGESVSWTLMTNDIYQSTTASPSLKSCPTPSTNTQKNGSITVCLTAIDAKRNIDNGIHAPPTKFTVSGIIPANVTQGIPGYGFGEVVFNSPLVFNKSVFNNQGIFDVACQTINNVPVADYYYDEMKIEGGEWAAPLYNDQFTDKVTSINDFLEYNEYIFDGNAANDYMRDMNSDGHIVLNSGRPHRTLMILTQYDWKYDPSIPHPVEPVPEPEVPEEIESEPQEPEVPQIPETPVDEPEVPENSEPETPISNPEDVPVVEELVENTPAEPEVPNDEIPSISQPEEPVSNPVNNSDADPDVKVPSSYEPVVGESVEVVNPNSLDSYRFEESVDFIFSENHITQICEESNISINDVLLRANIAITNLVVSFDGGISWIPVSSADGLGTSNLISNSKFQSIEDGIYDIIFQATTASGQKFYSNKVTIICNCKDDGEIILANYFENGGVKGVLDSNGNFVLNQNYPAKLYVETLSDLYKLYLEISSDSEFKNIVTEEFSFNQVNKIWELGLRNESFESEYNYLRIRGISQSGALFKEIPDLVKVSTEKNLTSISSTIYTLDGNNWKNSNHIIGSTENSDLINLYPGTYYIETVIGGYRYFTDKFTLNQFSVVKLNVQKALQFRIPLLSTLFNQLDVQTFPENNIPKQIDESLMNDDIANDLIYFIDSKFETGYAKLVALYWDRWNPNFSESFDFLNSLQSDGYEIVIVSDIKNIDELNSYIKNGKYEFRTLEIEAGQLLNDITKISEVIVYRNGSDVRYEFVGN